MLLWSRPAPLRKSTLPRPDHGEKMKDPNRTRCVLSLLADLDTAADLEGQIRDWISHRCTETGQPRSRVGRDLIHRNGYSGIADLAEALKAALSGDLSKVLSHTRLQDQEEVRTALEALTSDPAAPTSKEWCEPRINKILGCVVSAHVARTGTDYSETLGQAGEWLTLMMARGYFDALLSDIGTVPKTILRNSFLHFTTKARQRSAQDALHRDRGARTATEITRRRSSGQEDYIMHGAEQIPVHGHKAISHKEADSGRITYEFVSAQKSAEDHLLREERIKEAERLISARHRGSADRYCHVFRLMSKGLDKREIAVQLGVAECRASTLMSRVRKALQSGEVTRRQADRVLRMVAEGVTDRDMQQKALRIDRPEMRKILAYLDLL
jgi:hypothetical protein